MTKATKRILAVGVLAVMALLAVALPAYAADTRCTGVIGPVVVGNVVVPEGQVCELAGTTVKGNVRVEPGADLIADGANIAGNVGARRDAFVDLLATDVRGNVKLGESLGLAAREGTLDGNVQSVGSEFIDLFRVPIDGNVQVERRTAFNAELVRVAGNLEAKDVEFFDLYDSEVDGNFKVERMTEGGVLCGNAFDGNADFLKNATLLQVGGEGECGGNNIEGNIKVEDTDGDTTVANNTVGGNLACSGNTPPPNGGGNRVEGNREGQCAALGIEDQDETDPTVTAELDGETDGQGRYIGEVTATLAATDDVDPDPVIEYTLGSGVWATYEGPVTISEPGEYAMKFRGRDAAGNASDVGSVEFVTLAAPPSGTVWLSDHSWMSAENGWGPVERDQSNGETAANDGRPLTIGGQTFEKGLGVHAPSNVAYYLGGACTRLTAQVGVDDEVSNNGNVVFRVIGDGEVLTETGALTGADGPEALDADVSGVDTVELVVGLNGSATADHADWADLQVICEDVESAPADETASSDGGGAGR